MRDTPASLRTFGASFIIRARLQSAQQHIFLQDGHSHVLWDSVSARDRELPMRHGHDGRVVQKACLPVVPFVVHQQT